MPGVTSTKSSPAALRMRGASCAEHTTPSRPLARSRRAASASAASASGKSSGTMMRLLSNLHPCEMAPRAVELGRAPRLEGFPSAARGALPVELPRLEAAVLAQVHGERLRVRMHESLHELQVLAPLGRRAHQLRVDEAVEPHQRRDAGHIVA